MHARMGFYVCEAAAQCRILAYDGESLVFLSPE